jgi:hypothetical protein
MLKGLWELGVFECEQKDIIIMYDTEGAVLGVIRLPLLAADWLLVSCHICCRVLLLPPGHKDENVTSTMEQALVTYGKMHSSDVTVTGTHMLLACCCSCRHNGEYKHTDGMMEQVLMDKMLGFLKDRQEDSKRFFTYYAPFSIHKRCAQHTVKVIKVALQMWLGNAQLCCIEHVL